MKHYEELADTFKKLADNNKLSHAYLFYGENREEKIIFAQSLANFLENKNFEKPTRLLKEALIIEPDEKGTIGIDTVRSLKYFLWQKPTSLSLRTAIIKEAGSLTSQAQNAALKIVEEPPESALIIFISKNIEDLLPVLTSRLQRINFPETATRKTRTRANAANSANNDTDIDCFFENLIGELKKNPIKNSQQLKEALRRLALIKQFNINKRLQIKAVQ